MIDLDAIIAQHEPRIRVSFMHLVGNMKREASLEELAELIESGRTEEALALVMRSAPNIYTASSVAWMAAANYTAKQIGIDLGEVVVNYDFVNQSAVTAMRENQLRLIHGFTETQKLTTRSAIVEGIRAGDNPRKQAKNLINSLGLTPSQNSAVVSYERALRGASKDALRNRLRNKADDVAVARAAALGEALPEERITRMVAKYRARWIAYRATTIARTEALRSVHEGSDSMFAQAFADGTLDEDNVFQTWHTAKNERVRGSHRFMHRQERKVGEAFLSGLGNLLMRPGDSSAPAADVINCRCRKTVQIRTVALS